MIDTLSDYAYVCMYVCGYAYTHTGMQQMQKGGSWGEGRNLEFVQLSNKLTTSMEVRTKPNTHTHTNAVIRGGLGLCGHE